MTRCQELHVLSELTTALCSAHEVCFAPLLNSLLVCVRVSRSQTRTAQQEQAERVNSSARQFEDSFARHRRQERMASKHGRYASVDDEDDQPVTLQTAENYADTELR